MLRNHPIVLGATCVALAFCGAIGAERAGYLPEQASGIVSSIDGIYVDRIADLVGIELPRRTVFQVAQSEIADPAIDWQATFSALQSIRVEAKRPQGYDRNDWRHWEDLTGNCRDTRQEVLVAQSLEAVRTTQNGCRVVAGVWFDRFTGETFSDPSDLDIDHLVPLAEAWRSGGRDWSDETRMLFANDLEGGRSLIAVSASANRSKSDSGPADWLPPRTEYVCNYVADWIFVKARWQLSMDERERVTVGNIVSSCYEAERARPVS